jgi:hypothetical protein
MMPKNSYKDWFPHILIGLTILLALASAWWVSERSDDEMATSSVVDSPPSVLSGTQYRREVESIFEEFLVSKNREGAFADLFDMRVESSLRSEHLELILLFDDIDYSQQEVVNYAENYLSESM